MEKIIKKLLTALFIIFAGTVAASIFGIIHDQITFSISPEYYTHFKFSQFGLVFYGQNNSRALVIIVGLLATWWFGLILGIAFSLVSLFLNSPKDMIAKSFKAVLITLLITVMAAIAGYLYGKLILINSDALMNIYGVEDFESFLIVGSIHNYSYIGGGIGIFAGSLYIYKKVLQQQKR